MKVTSLIEEPFEIDNYAFDNETFQKGTLYVPIGTKAKYQATEGWKNFVNIVEIEDPYKPHVGDIFAAHTVEGISMTFKVTSVEPMTCQVGNGTETAIKTSQTGVVTIPAEAKGCAVTSISSNAFKGCKLTECVIPASVTNVYSGAFGNNENLEGITTKCTTPFDYDEDAFDDPIYAVTILNVPQAALQTFQAAPVGQAFTNVQATPQSGTGGYYMVGTLFNEPVWKEHLMTCKVTSTEHCQAGNGNKASVFAESAKSIKLPEQARGLTLNVISRRAFYNCANLETVFLTEKIEEIGEEAFYGCNKLQTLDLPRSVTKVANNAFNNSGLCGGGGNGGSGGGGGGGVRYHTGQEHLIPNNVNYEQLPSSEEDYVATREIHILAHITKIAEHGAFSFCRNIVRMYVDDDNPTYDSREDCNAIIRTADNMLLYGCQNTVIPRSVTAINTCAFEGHDGLTKIRIPAKVKEIGRRAFAGCVKLNRVFSFIRNPEPFNDDTFSDESYENGTLYVPSGKKEIYQTTQGWKNFKQIVEMNPPQDVIIFADPMVKDICVENWDTDDGELSETEAKEVTRLDLKFYGKDITSFNELQYFTGLRTIGERAFSGCQQLKSITLPTSITSIGDNAFTGCQYLEALNIPAKVRSIGESALAGLINLQTLTVDPANPYFMAEDNVLYNKDKTLLIVCMPQKSGAFTVPVSVKVLRENAFYQCNKLIFVALPEGLTTIGAAAFVGSGITTLNIPASVTDVGYDYDCPSLSSITVDAANQKYMSEDGVLFKKSPMTLIAYPPAKGNVYEIPEGTVATHLCSFLNSRIIEIHLPSSVKTVDTYSFAYCKNLTSVTVHSKTPPTCYNGAFYQSGASTGATLFVPAGSKSAYAVAEGWKDFMNIEEFAPTDIEEIDNGQFTVDKVIYNLNGQRLTTPRKGINIINGKKILVR